MTALLNDQEQVDAKRFPNFAALSRALRLVSQCPDRRGHHRGGGAGDPHRRLPEAERRGHLSDHPRNLFTLFDSSSYRMNVSESATSLCPPAVCPGRNSLAERLAHVSYEGDLPRTRSPSTCPVASRKAGLGLGFSPARTSRQTRFAASLRSEGPSLNVLHVELPHAPYQYMPDGNRYSRAIIGVSTRRSEPRTRCGLRLLAARCRAFSGWSPSSSTPIACWAGSSAAYVGLASTTACVVHRHRRSRRQLHSRPLVAGWAISDPSQLRRDPSGPAVRQASRPAPGREILDSPVRTIDSCRRSLTCSGFHIPWKVDGR